MSRISPEILAYRHHPVLRSNAIQKTQSALSRLLLVVTILFLTGCPDIVQEAVVFKPDPAIMPENICPGDTLTATWGLSAPAPVRITAYHLGFEIFNQLVNSGTEASFIINIPTDALVQAAGDEIHVTFTVEDVGNNTRSVTLTTIKDGQEFYRTLSYISSNGQVHTYRYEFGGTWSPSAEVMKTTLEQVRFLNCFQGPGPDGEQGTEDDQFDLYNFSYRLQKGPQVDEILSVDTTWNTGENLSPPVQASGVWEFILENGPGQFCDKPWVPDQTLNRVTFVMACGRPE